MVKRSLPSREELLAVLDDVMDPEVPVLSVVELGIVRDVVAGDEGVTVSMTPTYSGCPAMREIETEVRRALEAQGFGAVTIRTTYSPAWTTDWLTETARNKLEAYGIAPPSRVSALDLVPLLRRRASVRCPYCKSLDTEQKSEFGSTACKSIWMCNGCAQPFEEFKAI
jgi:ring-1,2-phenylacetyl-CoA epoxidase subunit PaaD